MRSLVIRAILAITIILPIPVQAAESAKLWFDRGVDAFNDGRYDDARRAFQQAADRGMATPGLDYNLGVTYYRLDNHESARRKFRELLDDEDWRPVALYNLGLVAEKQGRSGKARSLFRRARNAGNDRIARLAARKLDDGAPALTDSGWFFSLGGGYDSNIELAPDDSSLVSDQGDQFIDGYVTGWQALDAYWEVHGSAYARRYDKSRAFDESLLEVGVDRLAHLEDWSTRLGPQFSVIRLDGRTFQRRFGFDGEMERRLDTDARLELDGDWILINADAPYQYLDGWRARAGARWIRAGDAVDYELGYEIEFNQRDGHDLDPDFYSHSPIRQEFVAGFDHPLVADWILGGELGYEYAWYREAHQINGVRSRREDNQVRATAELIGRLSQEWGLYVELTHERQRSTLDRYDYDRDLLQAGIEYQPR